MRRFQILAVLVALAAICQAQSSSLYENIEDYKAKVIPSKFQTTFSTEDNKEDFKLLREFLDDRQNVYEQLKDATVYYNNNRAYYIPFYQDRITQLTTAIGSSSENDKIEIEPYLLYDSYNRDDTGNIGGGKIKVSVADLKNRISDYSKFIAEAKQDTAILRHLTENLAIVKDDISRCKRQIDQTLAPEYKQQNFRKQISITFSILIAVLLISFFLIVFLRSDQTLSKELLGGNGLQFVTLFVLIISIILFGILGILGNSELAAILSGISGYILGKGSEQS